MEPFIEEILADIDWRVSELAILKSIPIKYSLSPNHKKLYIKYSIPSLYSIWEGFVKSVFIIYSNHLNSLYISRSDISISLLTHSLDSECDFNNPRSSFNAKVKMVKLIDNILNETIKINPNIPTESNINCKVLNKILERFCIPSVDTSYERRLNKFLKFRNMIAHGENALSVEMSHLVEFVSLIEDLMIDIVLYVQQSEKDKTYENRIVCS